MQLKAAGQVELKGFAEGGQNSNALTPGDAVAAGDRARITSLARAAAARRAAA